MHGILLPSTALPSIAAVLRLVLASRPSTTTSCQLFQMREYVRQVAFGDLPERFTHRQFTRPRDKRVAAASGLFLQQVFPL